MGKLATPLGRRLRPAFSPGVPQRQEQHMGAQPSLGPWLPV